MAAEQYAPGLPVLRHARVSRPRRRVGRLGRRGGGGFVEASSLTAPSTTGLLGSIASVFPVTDVIAGATARAASQSTIHPLDTIKVRMQAALKGNVAKVASAAAPVSTGKYGIGATATSAVLGKVGTEVSSLYRGVFGAAGGAGLAIGAYFAFYGAAKKALEQNTDFSVSTVAFVAGGVGALGSSIVKVPAAVCIRSVQANVYPNVIVAARSITKAAGPRGMFTGYLPTLLEDVPDMAVKFAAYETMRTAHRKITGLKQEDSAAAADISMGLIAGAVAAGATTPLDVVKTRMMCNASQRPSFAGAIASVWRDSPPGMGRAKTFFTGVGPRAFSNGINSAIFFCFFEQLRVVFKQQDERRALMREAQRTQRTREATAEDSARRREGARGGAPRGDAVDAVYTTAKRTMRVTEASMTLAQKRGAAAKK
jgi:solute carrier family 25 (mitochondrial S-adenosylmethionine transporter), member 26